MKLVKSSEILDDNIEKYLIINEGVEIGYISIKNTYEIAIFINSDNRRKGFGKRAMELIRSMLENPKMYIYIDNIASMKLAQASGFKMVGINNNNSEWVIK